MRLLKRILNDLHDANVELYKSSGNNYYEGVADGYDMALQQIEAYEKRLAGDDKENLSTPQDQ